jgi:hypothetical protein
MMTVGGAVREAAFCAGERLGGRVLRGLVGTAYCGIDDRPRSFPAAEGSNTLVVSFSSSKTGGGLAGGSWWAGPKRAVVSFSSSKIVAGALGRSEPGRSEGGGVAGGREAGGRAEIGGGRDVGGFGGARPRSVPSGGLLRGGSLRGRPTMGRRLFGAPSIGTAGNRGTGPGRGT